MLAPFSMMTTCLLRIRPYALGPLGSGWVSCRGMTLYHEGDMCQAHLGFALYAILVPVDVQPAVKRLSTSVPCALRLRPMTAGTLSLAPP